MGCFSGCLMSSASIQKLFCGIYSAFKCSFDEFVGEKVVSPSCSSAILGQPPSRQVLYHWATRVIIISIFSYRYKNKRNFFSFWWESFLGFALTTLACALEPYSLWSPCAFHPYYVALCASKACHRLGSESVSWCLETSLFKTPLRRKWQPTPVFLAWRIPWTEEPGGLYSPRGHKESDMTEWLHFHFPGTELRPYHFCLSFCLLYFFLPPFKENGLLFWVPDVLCQYSEVVLWNLLSV